MRVGADGRFSFIWSGFFGRAPVDRTAHGQVECWPVSPALASRHVFNSRLKLANEEEEATWWASRRGREFLKTEIGRRPEKGKHAEDRVGLASQTGQPAFRSHCGCLNPTPRGAETMNGPRRQRRSATTTRCGRAGDDALQ